MKNWYLIPLGIFIGLLSAGALFLIASPPRGSSIVLLPPSTPAPILVQVDGAVQKPGVYALSPGDRVQQAIQSAGGFRPQANQSVVNLAAHLKDGDKITVPELGTPAAAQTTPETSPRKAKSTQPATPGAIININTAASDELQTLPGIGEVRAQQIIDYRQAHGGFKTVEELQNVSGIGPATFERLKNRITIH